MENGPNISKDDVIAKIKDDGDFDKLRLKIIRQLKDNEELRDKIITIVKQSKALNQEGAENLKPRKLSDAIHEEVGNQLMAQISDGLWEIIRSPSGMQNEIAETVKSVYDAMLNPKPKEIGESSSHLHMVPIQNGTQNNGTHATLTNENNGGTFSEDEQIEPPGFSREPPNEERPSKKPKEEAQQLQNVWDHPENAGIAPPGFSANLKQKQPLDNIDEDPDVPPGFG